MTHKYRVLIVDDSAFMRTLLGKLLSDDPDVEVVGTARNGAEAVDRVKQLRPDVVTMDMEMPVMNGIDALAKIMQDCPTPVIMLSSHTTAGADATITALSLGAFDFLPKPSGSSPSLLLEAKEELLSKLKTAAEAPLRSIARTRLRTSERPSVRQGARTTPLPERSRPVTEIVAIGTSTGGPTALEAVLAELPAAFPAPIVVVQHMPPAFTKSLARRLNGLCLLQVTEAEHNQEIVPGIVYIAPGGFHMEVVSQHGTYRIRIQEGPKRNEHRPSVDVLFESIAAVQDVRRHLVIMTGMGSDGAKGMKAARQAGATTTIAEAEETCVVFGMPRSAIALDCVDHVVPLHGIADKLLQVVGK